MIGSAYDHTAKLFHLRLFQNAIGQIATVTVIIFLLTGCLLTAVQQYSGLFRLDDTGYGDSYVLYDVLHFQKSGVIYRDSSLPPYLPAQYSPMMYILYSIPGRIASFPDQFLGPRLMALGAFLLCVLMAVSIARSLLPGSAGWLWALMLAGSIGTMRVWALQLRGDFPGVFFDLLAIRLLFNPSRRYVLMAGLCAGFATQFKITYVTALAAGSLWFLVRRRWRGFGTFAVAGIVSSIGIYLFFWAREHQIFQEMVASRPSVADFHGLLKLIYKVADQPVVLLAALALSPAAWRAGSRWGLLILFALTSFSIASLTDIQAGGNVNYYSEGLFALVPAAVLGVHRLLTWARYRVGAGAFVTALFLLWFLAPLATEFYDSTFGGNGPSGMRAGNETFRKLEAALHGRHIFSTVPRIALLDSQPALLEPYLLSYALLVGKFDPAPILRRIRADEFDVVVTRSEPVSWRGIPHIAPALRHAITVSYRPYCVYSDNLLHLPMNRSDNSVLKSALNEIGCLPVVCNSPSVCPAW